MEGRPPHAPPRPRLVPADSTDLAEILDEELSRGSRHGIYLRALAAAEALM